MHFVKNYFNNIYSNLINKILTFFISMVWLINGLYCKVLNQVPRHQLIVSKILGQSHAELLTIVIGISEIFISFWILSQIKSRFCAYFQIIIIGLMNLLEIILVPDLLLFGYFNIIFAALFMIIIYVHQFGFRYPSILK